MNCKKPMTLSQPMLFKRRPKWPELQLTQRQLAALARRPERRAKKLREKLPLLAERPGRHTGAAGQLQQRTQGGDGGPQWPG